MSGIRQTPFSKDVARLTSRHGQLTKDNEQKLAKIIHDPKSTEEQKQQAIDTLVQANLKLVFIGLKRLIHNDEALSSALLGLFNAAKGFKPGKEANFATYALGIITRQVNKDINRDTTIIPPYNIVDLLTAIKQEQRKAPDLTDHQALEIILSRIKANRNTTQVLEGIELVKTTKRVAIEGPEGDDRRRLRLIDLAVARPDHGDPDVYLTSIVKKLRLTPLEEDILRYRIFEESKTQKEICEDHKVGKKNVKDSERELREALREYFES